MNTAPSDIPAILLDRNRRWAGDIDYNKYTHRFFADTASGQAPRVLWLGCSDSRVPETEVTDLAPGDIFVHRNIANQFHSADLDISAHAVLDYAVKHLHVRHVAIVGHTHCGGVEAAYKRGVPGDNSLLGTVEKWVHGVFNFQPDHRHLFPAQYDDQDPLIKWLDPLATLARDLFPDGVPEDPAHIAQNIAELTRENVKKQVENVSNTFPKGKEGDPHAVWIHGWVYDIERGRLEDLSVSKECVVLVPKEK